MSWHEGMLIEHFRVEKVIDARSQFVAMCLALCPPPTIPKRAPACLTNDVVRLIGERWVLKPVRRFIAGGRGVFGRVVSVGSTLGIVGDVESPCVWAPPNLFVLCWMGCDHALTLHHEFGPPRVAVMDMAHLEFKDNGITFPYSLSDRYWGNNKWAVLWVPECPEIQILNLDLLFRFGNPKPAKLPPSRLLWCIFPFGDSSVTPPELDVVFSCTEPSLIAEGNEALVLVSRENERRLLTVDLGKTISTGSLVVVKERICATLWGSLCLPYLFVDDSGRNVKVVFLVPERRATYSFDVNTAQTSKLCDSFRDSWKFSDRLVNVGNTPFDVFTGQVNLPATVPCETDLDESLMNRDLFLGPVSDEWRAVIDAQTGLFVMDKQVRKKLHLTQLQHAMLEDVCIENAQCLYSNLQPAASSASSTSSSSSCGHVVCRGCYRHIASVATLTTLREHAPLSVHSVPLSTSTTTTSGSNQDREDASSSENPAGETASQPGTTTHKSSNNRCEVLNDGDCSFVSVECPVAGCGATSTRVPDVSMLIPDIPTRDYMLQVMKEKEEEPEEGLCMFGNCMDENSVARKATLTCPRCKGMLFCESCFQIRHKAPGLKSHKGEPIPTLEVTEEHKCPKHPKKDLDLFCVEDNEPICYLCHVSSLHSTHKCVPLEEIGTQVRESILGSVSKIEETVALESEAIKRCEASILESDKTLHSIVSNIETETDSILRSMKQQVGNVVSDCTLLSSFIESHVKEHKECLEVCMSTHQRTITRAHEITKSNDVVSLVAADKKLKETLCECRQLVSSGAMTPCLSAKNITHHINIQVLKEILDGNDFASVQYNLQPTEVQGSGGRAFSIKALKERVVQLEKTLTTERALNSELRAQLEAKQQQLTL
ncbi:tripartite motif-containing protein 21 [Pelomyxa schiedti]|nr:tripartite motif-containing protein 21 [Pelomyxa schiedti]